MGFSDACLNQYKGYEIDFQHQYINGAINKIPKVSWYFIIRKDKQIYQSKAYPDKIDLKILLKDAQCFIDENERF